jgi:ATP sulfurylase
MGSEVYRSVVEQMHLPGGLPWTLPITLPVEEEIARRLGPGDRVTLRAPGLLAVLEVEDSFLRDLDAEAWQVFGTRDSRHPGVARLLEESPWAVGGPLVIVERPSALSPERTLDPTQTREIFERAGWQTVTAFQTRNPIHRAHEYLQKCALEITDGLLLHPLVGETNGDDLPALLRMRCYEVLLEVSYPRDRVVLAAIVYRLRTGCQWNALDETGICSSSTAHRRFQQWAEQGVFLELWRRGLVAYDKHVGIDWEWCSMDGAMGKSPLGGGKNRAQSHRPGKARHEALHLV